MGSDVSGAYDNLALWGATQHALQSLTSGGMPSAAQTVLGTQAAATANDIKKDNNKNNNAKDDLVAAGNQQANGVTKNAAALSDASNLANAQQNGALQNPYGNQMFQQGLAQMQQQGALGKQGAANSGFDTTSLLHGLLLQHYANQVQQNQWQNQMLQQLMNAKAGQLAWNQPQATPNWSQMYGINR